MSDEQPQKQQGAGGVAVGEQQPSASLADTPVNVEQERASLLDELGGIRQEIKENAPPLHLEIPGYKGKLWIRCRPYEVAKTEKRTSDFQKAQKKKQPIILAGACDSIIDATEQLMLLPDRFGGDIGEEGANLIPIDEVSPVGFDSRLLELFKVKNAEHVQNARQVVLAMYPTQQSVLRASITINEWLQGELDEESDEQFLGES
jgi:hypothetical protein